MTDRLIYQISYGPMWINCAMVIIGFTFLYILIMSMLPKKPKRKKRDRRKVQKSGVLPSQTALF